MENANALYRSFNIISVPIVPSGCELTHVPDVHYEKDNAKDVLAMIINMLLELDSQKSFLPSGNSSILILPCVGGENTFTHEAQTIPHLKWAE